MQLVESAVYRLVESKVYMRLFESITRMKEQTNTDGGKGRSTGSIHAACKFSYTDLLLIDSLSSW